MIFYVNFVSWVYSETSTHRTSLIEDTSAQRTFFLEKDEITLKLS